MCAVGPADSRVELDIGREDTQVEFGIGREDSQPVSVVDPVEDSRLEPVGPKQSTPELVELLGCTQPALLEQAVWAVLAG